MDLRTGSHYELGVHMDHYGPVACLFFFFKIYLFILLWMMF